jgi:hypothetical protein
MMPTLVQDFEVIAVDQRGMGLTDEPQDGYDTSGSDQRRPASLPEILKMV